VKPTAKATRSVAVFDVGLPPGIAFLRSLDRAGVPTAAYASTMTAPGLWSRHAKSCRRCPALSELDEFTDWLTEEMYRGRIDLVAPTSDVVAFATAEALARVGRDEPGHPSVDAVLDSLMKSRFATAMAAAGFPTPHTALPRSINEALVAAKCLGYPVLLKPRSHLGVGLDRGGVIGSEAELIAAYEPYEIGPGQSAVLAHDKDLSLPLLQKYHGADDFDVVSVTGCLGPDGEVLALGHSKKIRQWPPKTGVGTVFEAVGEQAFTGRAIEAVRKVIGSGIFELEVLVRRDDEEDFSAIDLNPRAFGQISLDIAHGRDLPLLWHQSVTGQLAKQPPVPANPPKYWQQAVPFVASVAVMLAVGPSRAAHLRDLRTLLSSVGATRSWKDPLPSLVLALHFLRHPGGLLWPFAKRRQAR
jgi:hypothetical protein